MDLAEGAVLHGGTYNAQAAGVAAALATVQALSEPATLEGVRARGEGLMTGIRELGARLGVPLLVQGFGSVFHTNFGSEVPWDYRSYIACFDLSRLARFVRALQDRGVRITLRGTWFVSSAHTEVDIEQTLSAVELALGDMRDGVDALAGS
jgi:glutamate-1-semialdehyde 2,1-aminomutase